MKRSIIQRIFGIPATKLPSDNDFWSIKEDKIIVDKNKIRDFEIGKAIRIEGHDVEDKILLVHGEDGNFHALQNKCTHGGRYLDPDPDTATVQCCSVGKSCFDYSGKRISGSATEDIKKYELQDSGNLLVIKLS